MKLWRNEAVLSGCPLTQPLILQSRRKFGEGKIYAERKNQNKCDRELYRALVEETEALAALNEKMTEELRPKVSAIIGEAEKAMADYAARIEALAGEYPGRPEHFGIIFNINVRKGNYDYAARDNALDFLLQPLRFVQYQKNVEAQNLFENNGRPEDWRN